MNFPVNKLEPVELEEYQIKEFLRPIIHTVLFNRLIEEIVPVDAIADMFDISYAKIDDAEKTRYVEGKLDGIAEALGHDKRGVIQLSFFTRKIERGFLYNVEKKLFWEQWTLPIQIVDRAQVDQERLTRQEQTSTALSSRLIEIVRIVNAKMDHIPGSVNDRSFALEFVSARNSGDWTSMFKKIFVEGPPRLIET